MAKSVKIDVDLKTSLDTAKGHLERVSNEGGFKKNPKGVVETEALIKTIEQFASQGKLTKIEINAVSKAFNDLYKILIKAEQALAPVSKEFKKLLEDRDKLATKRSDLEKQKDAIKEKGVVARKDSKLGIKGQLTKLEDFDTLVAAANIRKVNSKGEEYGQPIKRWETLAQNRGNVNQAGQDLYKQLQNRLDTENIALNNLRKEADEVTAALKELDNKIKEVAKKDASNPQGSVQATNIAQMSSDRVNTELQLSNAGSSASEEQGKANTKQNVEDLNKTLDKQASSLGKVVKNFTIYRIALGFVKKAIREAVKTVRELDKSLTEQAMVTGKTREQTYALLSQYQKMASRLGATSKEVAEVATQFMRQGKTTAEALQLTEAAVSAAKVAGITATDSVQYLTTALNGFRLAASDAMEVSDRFAAIAANSATSYEEIAIALSKVASQANLAGMSIDYTTALLAKGLETTREAPETIGTALKTVIARMREMKDFGETLEGDTNLNNVETQLAYVGIALRTTTGELRSTEDVLDELGRKWDELSANQQAAVAKALAGTRQQSRLIAMMTDYDRVLELEEISLRSAGATSAQASVYLEGLEASLNKVSVAWEKIVSSTTDSDWLTGLVDFVANILEGVNMIVSNTGSMIATMTILSVLGVNAVARKMQEVLYQKQLNALELQEKKIANQQAIAEEEALIAAKKALLIEERTSLEEEKQTANKELQAALDSKDENAIADAKKKIAVIDEKIAAKELEIKAVTTDRYSMLKQQSIMLEDQENWLTKINSGANKLLIPLSGVISLIKMISTIRTQAHKKHLAEQKKEAAVGEEKAIVEMAGNAAANIPIAGIAIAAGLLGLAVAGLAIAGAIRNAETSADKINKLTDQIYTLQKTATGLNTALATFDNLDNKIIKTTEDIEAMTSALDKAKDSLTNEQQEEYDALETTAQKAKYLQTVYEETTNKLAEARREQLKLINADRSLLVADTTEARKVQSAVYAQANDALYKQIDEAFGKENTSTQKSSMQSMIQGLLEQMSASSALEYANHPERIRALIDTMSQLNTEIKDSTVNIAQIMTSNDYTLEQKVDAYREAINELTGDARDAFMSVYAGVDWLSNSVNEFGISFMDTFHVAVDDINSMNQAFLNLQYTAEEAENATGRVFELLGEGQSVKDALKNLGLVDDAYKSILNQLDKIVGTTMLDMGQQVDSLQNNIQSFYEKAAKWETLSQSERTQFLSDNAELLKGDDELFRAFNEGDYNAIQRALLGSDNLKSKIEEQMRTIEMQIEIEKAKIEEDGEEADRTYLNYLENLYKTTFGDINELTQASIKLRTDQENAQLAKYKEYLEEERDALEKSLNDRRDAYQKYFDSINEIAEDEDYEEKYNQIAANLSRIGATADAASQQQAADLESQLKDLEKERVAQLRERAQEAVIKNIDDEVSQINDKFDELLDSNRLLLAAMQGDVSTKGTDLIAGMITKQFDNGATALDIENYVKDLKTSYGSLITGVDWDAISATNVNNNSMTLTVNGQEINLGEITSDELYRQLRAVLVKSGFSS